MKTRTGDSDNGSKRSSDCRGIPGSSLDLGRLAVAQPLFGELNIYVKPDGTTGAAFDVAEGGRRYGLTPSLRQFFSNPGTHAGWGWADTRRGRVFRFEFGQADSQPHCLVSIETADGRVDVPLRLSRCRTWVHGSWVAFCWKPGRPRGDGQLGREATEVFPLDGSHWVYVARLAVTDKLAFPTHGEVLQAFLDAVPGLGFVSKSDLELLVAALERLGADSRVPEQLQVWARVERTKVLDKRAEAVGMPVFDVGASAAGNRDSGQVSLRNTEPAVKPVVAGDVIRVKLQLD